MPLTRDRLVLDLEAYAEQRPAVRDRMIGLRRARRLRLGDVLVVEFENAETLTYQVQEMLFTERVTDAAEVARELAAYSRLLPDSHGLTATLIEVADVTGSGPAGRLAGLQHAVRLEVGPHLVAASEITGPADSAPEAGAESTYAVHFLRFAFDDDSRDAFRDPAVPAALVVDHESYNDSVPIDGETRRLLLADLAL
jgi:hypothetical protein